MELPENANPSTIEEYPPKYELPRSDGNRSLLNGLFSIVIYLGVGYLLLRRWDLLLIIFGILLLHEAGHFLAMKYFNYADLSIFFLPVIGAFAKGSRKEISQRQSLIILLAGPMPGLILGIILSLVDSQLHIGQVPIQFAGQILFWGNLINLLPIYPLDGGQLLNRIYFDEEGFLSNLFQIFSAQAFAVLAFVTGHIYLLIFPAFYLYKYFTTRAIVKLDKEIEKSGINIDCDYEDLTNEQYWKLRRIIIAHHPTLQMAHPGPPYFYDSREEKIAIEVENILQRTLIMDFSWQGKIILMLLWALTLASPWLLKIDFLLIKYLSAV